MLDINAQKLRDRLRRLEQKPDIMPGKITSTSPLMVTFDNGVTSSLVECRFTGLTLGAQVYCLVRNGGKPILIA